jgi:hypothetical protein
MEKWDSSDEKVHEITIEMYGTPEEVSEMAKPIRETRNFDEARRILHDMVMLSMTSRSHLVAVLSNSSIKKILSGPAVADSISREAHLLAAANLDKLFANAIEPWSFELNPTKNNDNIKNIPRLYAPLEYKDRIITVKITVKEMKSEPEGKRIYSIKAVDAEKEMLY